ncbi:MAG: hypothetical protein ACREOZ_01305 [Gloeomargaritales cyanobacterium]
MVSQAQSWERLLYESGGQLALHKCFWYLLRWEWKGGTPTLVEEIDDQLEIALTSGLSEHKEVIQRLSPSTGHRTLGVRIAPSGYWVAEQEYLMRIASTMSKKIVASHLKAYEAHVAFMTIYRPKIEYSSPVVGLTMREANEIHRPIINAVLNKMRMNRHMPRAVIFGPHSMGGLEWPQLYIEQGINHINIS